ncbi:hypothetical protein SGRIM128S_03175 [Streptomyces griseomycini]
MGRGRRSTPASAATPWTACSPGPCGRSRPGPTRPADIDWPVQIDSTIVRAHQHAAATGRKGGSAPAGRTGRSRPRPIPRRTDDARSASPATARAALWPSCVTPGRRHDSVCARPLLERIRVPRVGPRPATLPPRPGYRGQGLQLPRIPRLPATTRHRPHHPREGRPDRDTGCKRGSRGGRPPAVPTGRPTVDATPSNAASTDSRASAASPPDTTRPPPPTKQRSPSHRSCSGQDPFEVRPRQPSSRRTSTSGKCWKQTAMPSSRAAMASCIRPGPRHLPRGL